MSDISEDEHNPLLGDEQAGDTYGWSVQYRGEYVPAEFAAREQRKRRLAAASILVTVTLERLAFYALAGNLFLFLNHHPLDWPTYDAMTALYVFTGSAFGGALFTGWLGDIFGRFPVICVALVIYTAGFSLFPVLAQDDSEMHTMCFWKSHNSTNGTIPEVPDTKCGGLIYVMLVMVGICASAVKANIAPFGAEQVRSLDDVVLRGFFNWFYWCTNVAALLALGLLAWIQQSTPFGFFLGYIIPACGLGVATLCFILCRPLYVRPGIMEDGHDEALHSICGVIREAWRHRRSFWICCDGEFLDRAKIENGGRYTEQTVEDVKKLDSIIIVFMLLIPYWLIYFQMQTTFQEQGLHMRLLPNLYLPYDVDEFTIPAAWLTLFDVLFIVLFIPLMERCVWPALDRRSIRVSLPKRIAIGLLAAAIAMLVAGGLETVRLGYVRSNNTIDQRIDGTTYVAADLWVFWQIPQYVIIGLSEVFASITGLEFAYVHSPVAMQGIVMGLFNLSAGFGSFSGSFLMYIVQKSWLQAGAESHLNYYFFLLASIQTLFFLIFVVVTLRRRRPWDSRAAYYEY